MCPTTSSPRPANITGGEATSDYEGAFKVIDVDHDGKISGEDLRSFYTSISGSDTDGDDEMIGAMMAVADANKDGYVEYDEFENVLKEKKKKKKSVKGKEKSHDDGDDGDDGGLMKEVFKVMDRDGDGRLGFDDLKSYLSFAGIEVGDDEVNAMVKLGCGDHGDVRDGVSFHGFLRILNVHDLVSS